MPQATRDKGIQIFYTIWIGQIVSIIGSGLSAFALGIWIYKQTGSITKFSLMSLSMVLPSILLSPLAGALVDRWDRRRTMIYCNLALSFFTLLIAGVLLTGHLEFWHLYVVAAISSFIVILHALAFNASLQLLVPGENMGKASGMMHMGPVLARIIAPATAGILFAFFDLQGVLLVDTFTFIFAMATLLFVRFPSPSKTSEDIKAAKPSLFKNPLFGWAYITARPGLVGLLVFFGLMNFVIGLSSVSLTPWLLSFSKIEIVGLVGSVSSVGLLLGSIGMSVWGGPKSRIHGVLGFGFVLGIGFLLTGVQPSVILIGVASFFIQFVAPITFSSNQAIWLMKTAPEVQGRVFAVRMMIQQSTTPLAYLIGGPLCDKVFRPLLTADGPLSGSLGRIIGVGPNRGIGLMFVFLGLLTIIAAIAGYAYSPLRHVEEQLPDAIPLREASKEAKADKPNAVGATV